MFFVITLLIAIQAALAGPIVQTECGPVEGSFVGTRNQFLGIPYAVPPIGPRRWQPPEILQPGSTGRCWAEPIYNATFVRWPCVQYNQFTKKPFGSEDCLYLEIHTPATNDSSADFSSSSSSSTQLLPVYFWIHGGGLFEGAGMYNPVYGSPRTFAEEGRAVVVAVEYRVGALGFLALEELEMKKQNDGSNGNSSRRSGNYGLLDVIRALHWTKRNIQNFGGDPSRVTIFGQSAGAQLVLNLVASPLAKGLFRGAYSMSALPRMSETIEESYSLNYDLLIQTSPCASVERGEPLRECLYRSKAFDWVKPSLSPSFTHYAHPYDVPSVSTPSPASFVVVDGWSVPMTFPEAFYDSKQLNEVDLVMGVMREEIDLEPWENLFNDTKEEYENWVVERFDAFKEGMGQSVLNLYPSEDYQTAQQAFDNIGTDIMMTCPNLKLVEGAASQLTNNNVYAFIGTQQPQYPVCFRGPEAYCAHYAFHGFDAIASFGNSQIFGPFFGPRERTYAAYLRNFQSEFAAEGSFKESVWPTFGKNQTVMLLEYPGKVARNPKAAVCAFWEENGFIKEFSWVN